MARPVAVWLEVAAVAVALVTAAAAPSGAGAAARSSSLTVAAPAATVGAAWTASFTGQADVSSQLYAYLYTDGRTSCPLAPFNAENTAYVSRLQTPSGVVGPGSFQVTGSYTPSAAGYLFVCAYLLPSGASASDPAATGSAQVVVRISAASVAVSAPTATVGVAQRRRRQRSLGHAERRRVGPVRRHRCGSRRALGIALPGRRRRSGDEPARADVEVPRPRPQRTTHPVQDHALQVHRRWHPKLLRLDN